MSSLRNRGSALILVLACLALLISLGLPFLFSGRLRSEASQESFDRTRARAALRSAARFALYREAFSHPVADPTPLWDQPAEWNPAALGILPGALGDEWAASGHSWGVQVEDLQARVSLASAPPMLLQNLLHPCFLSADFSSGDAELPVTSTSGFPDQGLLFLRNRLLAYVRRLPDRFVLAEGLPEDPAALDGNHFPRGSAVVDARVMNLVLARIGTGGFHPPEFLSDLYRDDWTGAGLLEPEERRALRTRTALRTGAYGAPEWGPAVWLRQQIDPERPRQLRVSDARAFAPGTMIRLDPDGGRPLDLLVLVSRPESQAIETPFPVPGGFDPFFTRIRPLLREPVDLNAALPEVIEALAAGVRFRRGPAPVISSTELPAPGRDDWVTPAKARAFAKAVLAARPLTGPEDLWERVLAPLLESRALTERDAWALHLNGLDPNNGGLEQSTLPFGYRSGDRYLQRVDAAVRSRLGRTLARCTALQRVWAAPDGPLLRVWQTQEDLDDALRWGRGAQGTTTLPNHMPSLGGQHDPALGLTLRVGAWDPTGVVEPAARDEDAFVIPVPARETDDFGAGRGRTEHFDLEPSPLGWNVREQGPLITALADWEIGLPPPGPGAAAGTRPGFAEPLSIQGWFDLSRGTGSQALFDLYGPFATDRQRLTATLEAGELVVRAYDNAGDDPRDRDNLLQAVEVRVDPSEYPQDGRWLHLAVLLRGVSARGVQVAVDGVPRGRIQGFTHLTAALPAFVAGSADDPVFVESTEGFPSQGVLRIGDEVIEYSSKTAGSFVTVRDRSRWIGGRAARETSDTLVNVLDTEHPAGAGVEVYGYSAILKSNLPPGGGSLTGQVGPFSVANAIDGPDTVSVLALNGDSFEVGDGLSGNYLGPVDLMEMAPGDPYYAQAFQSDGGYALLFQPATGWSDMDGFEIGGYEIVRYAARQGTVLNVVQRNVQPSGLVGAPGWAYDGRARTFVTDWRPEITDASGQPLADRPEWRVFVMPISVKGTRVDGLRYLDPEGGEESEFVQITESGDDGLTEWVRYDRILGSAFVRDDWDALSAAVGTYVFNAAMDVPLVPPDQGGGGGTFPGGSPGTRPAPGGGGRPGPIGPGGGLQPHWQAQGETFVFVRTLGEPVAGRDPAIEDIRDALDFRGVLGTFDHAHAAGARLVPVFRTWRGLGPWSGQVGRLDRVAVLDPGSQTDPPWFTVQWATGARGNDFISRDVTFVAFDEHPLQPWIATPFDPAAGSSQAAFDPRSLVRLVKFPSDERPLALDTLSLGAEVAGRTPPFEGFIDEISVHVPAGMGPPGDPLARGALILAEDFTAGETRALRLENDLMSLDGQRVFAAGGAGGFLERLPASGILDLDGERIGYSAVDAATGRIAVAPGGRGMHGTQPRGHAAGTRVRIVDGRAAAALLNDLGAGDAILAVEDGRRFGPFPLLLVDQELLHSSHRTPQGELAMPRWRQPAGGTQRFGDGILRGRFGTAAAGHAAGTLVYDFPCRWQDRYVPQNDSPAAAWFEFSLEEPDAWWRGIAYEAEVPDPSQKIRVLARAGGASWEDPPGTPGLAVVEQGRSAGGGPAPLGLRGDRLDLRVVFDWDAGAFDPVDFLATGWTSAPRLSRFVVDYLAESRIERHEEIRP